MYLGNKGTVNILIFPLLTSRALTESERTEFCAANFSHINLTFFLLSNLFTLGR